MASILFVHGTGVRREGSTSTLEKIRTGLLDQGRRLSVEGCLWGDPLGSDLRKGRSIPTYLERGGQSSASDEELEIDLWMHLYDDALYELRVLSVTSPPALRGVPGQTRPGDVLDAYARRVAVPEDLRVKLTAGGVAGEFEDAHASMLRSPTYEQFIQKTPASMGAFQMALARALVAGAIALYRERYRAEAAMETDAALRNDAVELVRHQLGPYEAAVGDWIVRKLLGVGRATVGRGAAIVGTSLAVWRRGSVSDVSSPMAGDILLYQCRGSGIRNLIRTRLEELTPPVILLGHSLGGIACVEMLIETDLRNRVPLLITVGSQAPYFYEINALDTLEYGHDLPSHMPAWINIFDLRDLLSYVGEELFPGRVKDVKVDNRQPFPQSHSAYWSNPNTFSTIADALRSVG